MSQPTFTDDLERLHAATLPPAPRAFVDQSELARRRAIATFLVDFAAVSCAALALLNPERAISRAGLVAMALVVLGSFAFLGRYTPSRRRSRGRPGLGVLQVPAVGALIGSAVALLLGDAPTAADTLLVWLVVTGMVIASRGTLHAARSFSALREPPSRTLIVGAGRIGQLAAKRLMANPALGLQPVGFLDKEPLDDPDRARDTVLPVLGASWDLEEVIAHHGVDSVLIAFSTAPHAVMLDLVRRCWALGVDVSVVPRLFEVEGRRIEVQHVGALPLVSLGTSDPLGTPFVIKYAVDRAVAAAFLVLLAPLLLLISAAVLITSGRPVLFRQRRVGRDGRHFDILKFRTMRGAPERDGDANREWARIVLEGTGIDATEALRPTADRRTPLGRVLRALSMDELPQLWNVLRGDMSLVGPRPEMPHYVEQFENAIYRYPDRHRVKSGLTGWAQIHGLRGDTSLPDRIEWDNFYIENWTPWLDIKILLLTVPAVLRRQGAS